MLTGARDGEPYALRSVARLAAAVGDLLLSEQLGLVELNPVLVGRGADGHSVAVDAVVRV